MSGNRLAARRFPYIGPKMQCDKDRPIFLARSGLNFLIRDGRLCSTTIMRSKNAVRGLPVNLFEFCMLAEAMAMQTGAANREDKVVFPVPRVPVKAAFIVAFQE